MLKSLAKHLSGIALTWVLVLAGTFFLLRWYSQPSAEREVPALAGLSRSEASETLSALGLQAVWQDSIYASMPRVRWSSSIPARQLCQSGRNILLTTYRITPRASVSALPKGRMPGLRRHFDHPWFEVKVEEEPNTLLAGKVLRVEHKGKRVDADARFPKGRRSIWWWG